MEDETKNPEADAPVKMERDEFADPPLLEAPWGHPMLHSVVDALRDVFDPEIPVSVYDLGLIYKIAISEENVVDITMTLTSPTCPIAGEMPHMVHDAVIAVPGVKECLVEMVFEPVWSRECMTEVAKIELSMF